MLSLEQGEILVPKMAIIRWGTDDEDLLHLQQIVEIPEIHLVIHPVIQYASMDMALGNCETLSRHGHHGALNSS